MGHAGQLPIHQRQQGDSPVADAAWVAPAPTVPPLALLRGAVAAVPAGAWAVAVSGGADSVALLRACAERCHRGGDQARDLTLHVVHLDHELRGAAATADAAWVASLAGSLGLPCTVVRRTQLESPGDDKLPRGLPARMRALRLRLLARVCAEHGLAGILLGHHRDDQAETILQRLIRRSPVAGLAGMSAAVVVGGVMLRRPLLSLSRQSMRDYLGAIGQEWREDASNALPVQQRNRVRMMLAKRPELVHSLLELGSACDAWRNWANQVTPWPAELDTRQGGARHGEDGIIGLPRPLARVAAAHWLVGRGVPAGQMSRELAERLLEMIDDAAGPRSMNFPGNIRVRRRRGRIVAQVVKLIEPTAQTLQGN